MSNTWDHERFRDHVLRHAANVGIQTIAELARVTGIAPAMLSKWFRGVEQPSLGSLERLAEPIRASFRELAILAGRLAEEEQPLPALPGVITHPLALEINQMLVDDSPLPELDRKALQTLLDRAIDPYRRYLRRRRPA